MDEPIRSHLPNENYRRGWDETFGDSRKCWRCDGAKKVRRPFPPPTRGFEMVECPECCFHG